MFILPCACVRRTDFRAPTVHYYFYFFLARRSPLVRCTTNSDNKVKFGTTPECTKPEIDITDDRWFSQQNTSMSQLHSRFLWIFLVPSTSLGLELRKQSKSQSFFFRSRESSWCKFIFCTYPLQKLFGTCASSSVHWQFHFTDFSINLLHKMNNKVHDFVFIHLLRVDVCDQEANVVTLENEKKCQEQINAMIFKHESFLSLLEVSLNNVHHSIRYESLTQNWVIHKVIDQKCCWL